MTNLSWKQNVCGTPTFFDFSNTAVLFHNWFMANAFHSFFFLSSTLHLFRKIEFLKLKLYLEIDSCSEDVVHAAGQHVIQGFPGFRDGPLFLDGSGTNGFLGKSAMTARYSVQWLAQGIEPAEQPSTADRARYTPFHGCDGRRWCRGVTSGH